MTATITPGQRKQVERLFQDTAQRILREAGLDKGVVQRFLTKGDEFRDKAINLIIELGELPYANEEVESTYGYLSGYLKPKNVVDQVKRLRELFSEVEISDPDESVLPQEVPEFIEGPFAILPWQSVASTYGEAVEKVLALLEKAYGGKFTNYCNGQLGEKYLRESKQKKVVLQKLREQQKGNTVLLVPAQFGILHRGRSIRRARVMFIENEFGLGAYEIGIMLLTHPERLQHFDDLWIDCAGDEFDPGGDVVFSSSVCFNFDDGWLEFGGRRLGFANGRCGSVSGVVPGALSPS